MLKSLKIKLLIQKNGILFFDFIERYLAISDESKAIRMQEIFNRILEGEVSAYRILDKRAIPITNKSELSTVEEAMNIDLDSVRIHLDKALCLQIEENQTMKIL